MPYGSKTSAEDTKAIVAQCRQEYDAGLKFRHDRERAWKVIEDAYWNRVPRTIVGRFNAPLPIVSGFVDTWIASMAKHVDLEFKGDDKAVTDRMHGRFHCKLCGWTAVLCNPC